MILASPTTPDAGRVVGTANMWIRIRRLSGQQETVMTGFHPATWQLMASVLAKAALLNLIDQPEILRPLDSHSHTSPLVDVVLLIRNYQNLGLAVRVSRGYGRICNLRAIK